MQNKTEKRNAKIKELREKGLTLQDIGNKYGLTRERVRQICLGKAYKPWSKKLSTHRG